MAYKTTGKPVGRPKTKDYKTISLKMPQELLDRVQSYARVHRQSVSELIRDSLEWRITEGDPRSGTTAAPQRTLGEAYSSNTEIPEEGVEASAPAGMLQEIYATVLRQEAQLGALTEALARQGGVPAVTGQPESQEGNTVIQELARSAPLAEDQSPFDEDLKTPGEAISQDNGNTVLHHTQAQEPAQPGAGQQTIHGRHADGGNTVLPEGLPAFDASKYALGELCRHGHAYPGTQQSLRRLADRECLECHAARARAYRQRKRQAQPA